GRAVGQLGERFVVVEGGVGAAEADLDADEGSHDVAVAVDLDVGVGGVNHGAEGAVAGDLVITDAGGVGAVDQEVLGAADFAGGERAVAVGVGAVGDAVAGDLDVALGIDGQLGVGGDGEFAAAAADVDAADAVGEHEHDLGAGGDREGFVVKVHLGGALVELAVGGGGVAGAGKRQAVGDGGEGGVGGGGGGFGGEVGGEVVGAVAVGDGAVGRAEGAD